MTHGIMGGGGGEGVGGVFHGIIFPYYICIFIDPQCPVHELMVSEFKSSK